MEGNNQKARCGWELKDWGNLGGIKCTPYQGHRAH